jgi:hypothetical protein
VTAERRLREVSDEIALGVERELPGWVRAQVERIARAWGRLSDAEHARLSAVVDPVARVTTARVVGDLRELLAADAVSQRSTPLQVVRSAYREPTDLLRSFGIPPVTRDAFDERAWPDDDYGLVPHTLGDLGDPDLGPLLLAWGLAKTAVLRGGAEPG